MGFGCISRGDGTSASSVAISGATEVSGSRTISDPGAGNGCVVAICAECKQKEVQSEERKIGMLKELRRPCLGTNAAVPANLHRCYTDIEL